MQWGVVKTGTCLREFGNQTESFDKPRVKIIQYFLVYNIQKHKAGLFFSWAQTWIFSKICQLAGYNLKPCMQLAYKLWKNRANYGEKQTRN